LSRVNARNGNAPSASWPGRGSGSPSQRNLPGPGALDSADVKRLIAAAGKVGRHRDNARLLLTHRHGLRVGSLEALRWEQVDLKQGFFHVTRLPVQVGQ